VTGDGLLVGEPVDLGLPEVAVQRAQALLVGIRQGSGAEQRAIGEGDQPLDLDLDTGAVEPGLGEEVGEPGDGGAVPAVQGAERLGRKRRGGESGLRSQGRSS